MARIRERGLFVAGSKSFDPLLQKHDCVREWADSYSSNTRDRFARVLDNFLQKHEMTPEQFLGLAADQARRLIWSYVQGYVVADKVQRAKMVKQALKSFYEFHNEDVELRFPRKKYRIPSRRKRVDYEIIPTREQIYTMADVAGNPRDKAIILCLFQSGMRRNALRNLNYGHVRDQLESGRIPIRLKITQNIDTKLRLIDLAYYYTFFGREAVQALRTYVDSLYDAGIKLTDESPLFQSKSGRRIGDVGIWRVVKKAAKRAGLDPKGVWSHCLRKSFRKVLNSSSMDEDTKEALEGHKLPGSRENYFDRHDIDEVEAKYLSCPWNRESQVVQLSRLQEELNKRDQRIMELEDEISKFGEHRDEIYAEAIDTLEKKLEARIQDLSKKVEPMLEKESIKLPKEQGLAKLRLLEVGIEEAKKRRKAR